MTLKVINFAKRTGVEKATKPRSRPQKAHQGIHYPQWHKTRKWCRSPNGIIAADPLLNLNEIRCLLVLVSHMNNDGICKTRRQTIADALGVDITRISKITNRLALKGWLNKSDNPGKKRTIEYHLCIPIRLKDIDIKEKNDSSVVPPKGHVMKPHKMPPRGHEHASAAIGGTSIGTDLNGGTEKDLSCSSLRSEHSSPPAEESALRGATDSPTGEPVCASQETELDLGEEQKPQRCPPCPAGKMVDLWAKHFPHRPQPRTELSPARLDLLQKGWRFFWNRRKRQPKPGQLPVCYITQAEGVQFWNDLMAFVVKHCRWHAFERRRFDIDDLFAPRNLEKIIDGSWNDSAYNPRNAR